MNHYKLNLHLFDGAEGGAAPAAGGAEAAAAADSGAAVQQEQAVETAPTFEDRMKALKDEFPDEHGKYMQSQFGRRMKASEDAAKAAQDQLDQITPMLSTLAMRYGIDAADTAALAKAVADDTSFLEDVAAEKGMSVEEFVADQANQAKIRKADAIIREQEMQQKFNQQMAGWEAEAEAVKAYYPQLDIHKELTHPETGERMLALLTRGVDVRSAYEVIHMQELTASAMAKTAQVVQEKTVNNIRANGMRPTENGVGGSNAAVAVRAKSPAEMSRKDREKIAQRVRRGERIDLSKPI